MAIGSTSSPMRLLAVALLGGGALLLLGARNPSPPPIYSVAAVRAGLMRSPGRWVGRTLRVRAVVGAPCLTWMGGASPACISWRPALLDATSSSAATALPLRGAPQPPLLATLRRLPLVRWLVGAPSLRWGALSTYRVRLQATSTSTCGAPHCYEALLLDAAPDTLSEQPFAQAPVPWYRMPA